MFPGVSGVSMFSEMPFNFWVYTLLTSEHLCIEQGGKEWL